MNWFRNAVAGLLMTLAMSLLVAGCGGGGGGGTPSSGSGAITLVSISVTPASALVAPGASRALAATATYSDASTKVITSAVSWNSSNPSYVTVDASGVVTGVATGSAVISATGSASGKSGNTTVTVAVPTLVSIAVTPANASVAAGSSQQMTATATYSDSSSKVVTTSVTWTSSNASAVTITNPAGLATGVSGGGDSVITAASGAVSGNTTVTVPINKIFVTEGLSNPEVLIFPRTASGTTTPTVLNSTTAFVNPSGIMVDRLHSEVYVLDSGGGTAGTPSIQVFKLTDSGASVTPQRVISGGSTGMSYPFGVYVDDTNNEIYVANWGTGNNGTITVYKRTDNGNAAPQRTIASTSMAGPNGISVDVAHNLIYVADYTNNKVLVFNRLDSGTNVTPVKSITGAAAGDISLPSAAIVDPVHGEIYVPNANAAGTVSVFSTSAGLSATPIRQLTNSVLNTPYIVSVDNVNNEVAVPNNAGNSGATIAIFSRTANGNTSPLRTFNDGITMSYPTAVDDEP